MCDDPLAAERVEQQRARDDAPSGGVGESQIVANDRIEEQALRAAEDRGGYRWVAGVRMDAADLPGPDEW